MTRRDPRPVQIAVLGSLLVWGTTILGFDVSPGRVAASVGTALGVQAAVDRFVLQRRFDPRSALISGLSLAVLLRTDGLGLAALAAALAIASKVVLRWRGRHVFNPSCFAIVALLAVTDRAWVSPAQWGSGPFVAFAIAALGCTVLTRVPTRDVTFAFLTAYAGLVLGRAAWLGDPLAIPLRELQTGALIVFAFFMISDPKTVPASRLGRLSFAAAVAASAFWVRYGLFRPNGLLWALAVAAPLVPLLDRLTPGASAPANPTPEEQPMRTRLIPATLALAVVCWTAPAHAFCGFYVAKADTKLFNRASQVVLVRDGDRTVLTMSNDYQGDPTEFATVIPVPTKIERGQIHVGDREILEHLDAYTAPRLVEYHDPNPCERVRMRAFAMEDHLAPRSPDAEAKARGVTIEARYTVGEYDILILSATESNGLATWLAEHGYRLPTGAEAILGSYIKQRMRFFVAKVNLAEHAKTGFSYLRPLQIAYESPKFMLPIRLGTLNADGPQELFIYALTRTGRVETTNYRTTRLPSDVDVPLFVQHDFADFYRAMFAEQVRRERMQSVFLEYAWDMGWCDPCAANPLSKAELEQLGVFWLEEAATPGRPVPRPRIMPGPRPQDVYVTRLHLRYDAEHFPADLVLQETGDRQNFQGRYVLRHPYTGEMTCDAAKAYRERVKARRERDAQTLAGLTGWSLEEIREKAKLGGPAPDRPWWRRLWDTAG
jgi:Na+-translocating ferredoxin:NAD+ oxidoreductase RnfD subunit